MIKSQPLDDFNWEEFESGTVSQTSSTFKGYDEEPVFHQGIAIVKRNGKYGAIMVGGKEIVPSIYDALTEFKDGVAEVEYKGEKRKVNLSGQIHVKHGNESVFLPDEYDWGFDFINNICVVVKNNKYGIINKSFDVVLECEYTFFEKFRNGFAIIGNNVINEKAEECFKIDNSFPDGDKIIEKNGQPLKGVMNSDMKIIIPVLHYNIMRLKSGYYVAESEKKEKIIISSPNGKVVSKIAVDKVEDINECFFATYLTDEENTKCETSIYYAPEKLLLTIPYKVNVYPCKDNSVQFSLDGLQYEYDVEGGLYIVAKKLQYGSSEWDFRWEKVNPRKVNHTYVEYTHSFLSQEYELIEDNRYKKGISNLLGDTIIEPQYNYIRHIYGDLFIVAVPNPKTEKKTLVFGVVDKSNKIIIPFEYDCLIPISDKYIAYTEGHIYNVVDNNEYWTMDFPSNGYYTNVTFGILDMDGKKISKPIFSKINEIKTGLGFIVGVAIKMDKTLKYGIIDNKGNYIVTPKYELIGYDEKDDLFNTTLSYSETGRYPFEKLSNHVSIDGSFVVYSDNGIVSKVPVEIADWCGSFNEGYAEVIKGGIKGKINKSNHIVAFLDEKCIVIPAQYNFACNFKFGYAPVSKNGKYGIIDAMQKEVIPCSYEYIEPLSSTRFKYKEGKKWGIIDERANIIVGPEYISISHQSEEHFKVELSTPNGSVTEHYYGLIDKNGKIAIPIRCTSISKLSYANYSFWIAKTRSKQGVYSELADVIIPFIYDDIEIQDGKFVCKLFEQQYPYSSRYKRVKYEFCYSLKGEYYLNIDDKMLYVVPSEYDIAYYAGQGLIWIEKDATWGLINMMNDVIISPVFSYFEAFEGSFAIVGNSDNGATKYFLDDHIWHMKRGLVDTFGAIVLPIEYDFIEKWDNGYYCASKDKHTILLSPSLHPVFNTERILEKLDDRYILIVDGYTKYGLIDYNGNKIIPTDDEHNFEEIEVLKNGFLKVTYHKGEYGSSHIAILNNQGKVIFEKNYDCDDIKILDYGYILIECNNYGSPNTYSLVNLQGKEILPNSYYEIKQRNDGMISIKNYEGWGLADLKGNIVIDTEYLDELVFEDGLANIGVKGSSLTQKINKNGIVIVHNGKNEIELPNSVYWGTDFINKVSIVRGKGRGYNVIGVANIKGNIIIPTRYKSVCLLSNKTFRVQDGDCYGIFDLKGNVIFPSIFTSIEYIDDDRIKVTWNLKTVKEWNNKCDYVGEKYKGYDNKYLVDNRSALCNYKGEIINDKEIILVGKFINGYARAYKEVTIEKGRVQLKQAGVVDTFGKTIIPLIYDGIIIYEDSPYIRLRKNGKYGIANLKSGKQKIFNKLDIKHLWDIDKLGRCVYSEDCKYDSNCEDWIGGTRGVLNLKGVLIPTGQYYNIVLLDNGLIKVSNEDGDLYGLLDEDGNEVIPIQYSYISSFKGNLATICINGKRDDEWPYRIRGGKWGVIDSTGKLVKECVSDREEVLEEKESDNKRTDNNVQFEKPSVVLSDRIPEPKERNSYDYAYDSYRDDDDEGPYSKYGGYNGWDDNTIDEAFDGNPELTWNID
ncbi:WG repeat-containing protein [Segatella maculosa]|uniref:WG repeat-containing protein n=1 Tax=Segatella maculosa OT 289 TaxID=999422 RepID=H1HPN0_9BACT|nr:WG repeat-containing protein [Segatella maculosa]EHO67827.1 hypothetical protein HMPREF9944_02124 [Segatella maculosa OT 289]